MFHLAVVEKDPSIASSIYARSSPAATAATWSSSPPWRIPPAPRGGCRREPAARTDPPRSGAIQQPERRRTQVRCCHNSANNGTNTNNILFDIRTASAEARTPDLPLYTFRNRTTGEERQYDRYGPGQHHRALERPPPLQDADDPQPRRARRTSTTASPRRSRTWCATTRRTWDSSSPTRNAPTSWPF